MFVTTEKEREMFIIFFLPIFCQLLPPPFQASLGWARPDHESSGQPAKKAALSNVVSLGCKIWSPPDTRPNILQFKELQNPADVFGILGVSKIEEEKGSVTNPTTYINILQFGALQNGGKVCKVCSGNVIPDRPSLEFGGEGSGAPL